MPIAIIVQSAVVPSAAAPGWVLPWAAGALGGAFVSGAIALWNDHLARERYVRERWWERKVIAYSDVIGQLAKLRSAVEGCIAELKDSEPDSEEWARQLTRWSDAAERAEELVLQESFLLADGAIAALEPLRRELAREDFDEAEAIERLVAIRRVLVESTRACSQIAKADLSVPAR